MRAAERWRGAAKTLFVMPQQHIPRARASDASEKAAARSVKIDLPRDYATLIRRRGAPSFAALAARLPIHAI